MRRLHGGSLLLVALTVGCGGEDEGAYDHYFAAKPYDNAACNVAEAKLPVRRELRLYTYGNADAPPHSRSLQRYYRRHGLQFFSTQNVTVIPQRYVLDTNDNALGEALTREFPGVDFSDEVALMRDAALYDRIVKFAMNFVFRPIIEFARAHGNLGPDVTNLVVVPDIVRPGGAGLGEMSGDIAGLAISPALIAAFAAEKVPEADGWQALDLPPNFTPMMFLDGKVIAAVRSGAPDLADLIAAHEFGHTGGLIHRMVPHNLMTPVVQFGTDDCTDSLAADQLDTLRATLGVTRQALQLARPPGAAHLAALLPPAQLRSLARGDRAALTALVRRLAD
jgi:hypothetical protein